MPDTRLLEQQASEILFGDKDWHETLGLGVNDEDVCYVHPFEDRAVSFAGLVRELAEVK